MCQHVPDSFADAGEYYSACLTCGEVLAQHSFTIPTLAQRCQLHAGFACQRAAQAVRQPLPSMCAPALEPALFLCLPEATTTTGLVTGWNAGSKNAQQTAKLPVRFAILASLEERYPEAPEEVSRRILLVDKALGLRLSRGSC